MISLCGTCKPCISITNYQSHASSAEQTWVHCSRSLLSKEVANISECQVYWECPELMASEQFPAGVPEELREGKQYQVYSLEREPHLNLGGEIYVRHA